MTHELAGLVARVGETKAVNHVVQAAFKNDEQVGTGNALLHIGFNKVAVELALQNAVNTAGLLLLPQLHRVFAHLFAGAAMLAGGIGAAIIGAFVGKATVALQKELAALATTHAALGFSIFCHLSIPLTLRTLPGQAG